MNNYTKVFVIIIVIICCLCKPKELIVNERYKNIGKIEELEEKIFNKGIDIKTLKLSQINVKLNIDGNQYNISGTIGIIKDSVIIVSIMPLMGYEKLRIYCKKDSIIIIDRTNKVYYEEDLIKKLNEYNLYGDYDIIQAILMNQPIVYGYHLVDEIKKKELSKVKGYYYYLVETKIGENTIIKQILKVDDHLLRVVSNEINDYQNRLQLIINYWNFKKKIEYIFPQKCEAKIQNNRHLLIVYLEINSIDINGKVNADIRIPVKYQKVLI